MRSLIGSVVVAFGVLLAVFGLDATECLHHRFTRLFDAFPTEKSFYLLAAGILVILIGLTLSFRRGRPDAP